MTRPRGEYGVDAPYVLVGLAAASVVAFALAGMLFAGSFPWTASLSLLVGVVFAASILSFAWTTRRGKFIVWSELLDALGLRGDEYLLDVGCGRGAVLMLAAKRLPHGRAVGLDLWSTADQSGNSEQATWRNADLEGVRTRVELRTGDMTNLPFSDESFDVVTSSLAIHNIAGARGREQALSEMLRVLRRGGTLMIADIRHAGEYQRYFAAQPDTSVQGRRLGWRFWYGGPYAATTLVTVRRSG